MGIKSLGNPGIKYAAVWDKTGTVLTYQQIGMVELVSGMVLVV